ncbi:ATP-dependent Clp protease proteolytic subunit-protein 4, chloroplastic [Dionaea muscipula]
MASLSFLNTPRPPPPLRFRSATCSASSSTWPSSLSSSVRSSFVGGSLSGQFPGLKLRPKSLFPDGNSRSRRGVVTMVIPFVRESARERTPPDIASYVLKERIVYLGMPISASVAELIIAELLFLEYDDYKKTIYMYINSTGTAKGERKYGYEATALAIYDIMSYIWPPIYTLCVGYAFGEAALYLAAGVKGHRAALPSSTMMIRQPTSWFQGQATDINLARKEVTFIKSALVNLYALHMGQTPKQIEADIERPKYFNPTEAIEYGIIDRVLHIEKSPADDMLVSKLKKSKLI